MSFLSKSICSCFALVAASLSAGQAQADTYGHIQKLALDIQIKSDLLMGETHHYVHTPNYRLMLRCVSEMRNQAVRVHVLSLQHGCLDTMAAHLNRLDSMYHQVEALFDDTEYEAGHGHGHIHGPTRHVKQHLKAIEDCIHHIQSDIASLRRPVYRPPYSGYPGYSGTAHGYNAHPRSRVRYGSGYRGPGHSFNRGGISLGNGKFNIRIGF